MSKMTENVIDRRNWCVCSQVRRVRASPTWTTSPSVRKFRSRKPTAASSSASWRRRTRRPSRLARPTRVREIPRAKISDVQVVDAKTPVTLPAAAKFREYTVQEGTPLAVKLTTAVSSETSHVEDVVEGELTESVKVDGAVVVPAGSVGPRPGRRRAAVRQSERPREPAAAVQLTYDLGPGRPLPDRRAVEPSGAADEDRGRQEDWHRRGRRRRDRRDRRRRQGRRDWRGRRGRRGHGRRARDLGQGSDALRAAP